jgi:hypothetical protein
MSFRSKRTFGDIHGNANISESRVDSRESPKSPKLSGKVSNIWGPFPPPTLKASVLPQSSLKAPQESEITSHVRKTTTSRVHSPPSINPSPAKQSMSTSHVRKTTTSRLHSPPSLNPPLAQQCISTSHLHKNTTSRVHSPPSINLSPPPSPTQGMPTNHDENERSNEDEDSNIEPSRSTTMSKSKTSKPRHRVFIKDWPTTVPFDEMESVATIGNYYFVSEKNLNL